MCALKLLLLLVTTASIDAIIYDIPEPTEWWQTTTLYQIWPRSFKDSDGDGIGDLNGITSKLEHFIDLGIGAIWLSPFYKSPLDDTGYDISNFIDVHPQYGTLEDFDELIATAHKLGIKVLLDFVPNHTSDEHEWFKKSKAGIEPYKDYYIWKTGIKVNNTYQPPNNWLSNTNGGSAWEWVEERKAHYFHQFNVKQVDLNYRNPQVIEETKDILTFWLEHGVDGFRVDSVNYLVEDDSLLDEPPSGLSGYESTDFYYLDHVYVMNQPENYEIVQIWRDHIDNWTKNKGDKLSRPLFTEAYANVSIVTEYVNNGAHVPFNFFLIKDKDGIKIANYETAYQVFGNITKWMDNLPKGAPANWVFSNHDNSRVATRYGQEFIDGVNFLLYLLPGVATTYNGDEIGMIDTDLTWEETEDPSACRTNKTSYTSVTRDPERTPYQWDDTISAGFSKNTKTVLAVNKNYLKLNLEAQKKADVSYYKNVQALIKLRKNPVVRKGNLDIQVIKDQVIAFARELDHHESIVVLVNWSNTAVTISLKNFKNLPNEMKVLIADINSGIAVGSVFRKMEVKLPGHAAVVLQGIQEKENFLKSTFQNLISIFG